jgi:uncharacterized membrane protein
VIAAVGYLVTPLAPLLVLLGDMKNDPYQRRHAVQALLWSGPFFLLLALAVVLLIVLASGFVVAFCLSPIVVALPFVPGAIWARRVYLGGDVTIPLLHRFAPPPDREGAQS